MHRNMKGEPPCVANVKNCVRKTLESDPCSYKLFCLESHILSLPKVLQIPPESLCIRHIILVHYIVRSYNLQSLNFKISKYSVWYIVYNITCTLYHLLIVVMQTWWWRRGCGIVTRSSLTIRCVIQLVLRLTLNYIEWNITWVYSAPRFTNV
jgi:hypothetical protein